MQGLPPAAQPAPGGPGQPQPFLQHTAFADGTTATVAAAGSGQLGSAVKAVPGAAGSLEPLPELKVCPSANASGQGLQGSLGTSPTAGGMEALPGALTASLNMPRTGSISGAGALRAPLPSAPANLQPAPSMARRHIQVGGVMDSMARVARDTLQP